MNEAPKIKSINQFSRYNKCTDTIIIIVDCRFVDAYRVIINRSKLSFPQFHRRGSFRTNDCESWKHSTFHWLSDGHVCVSLGSSISHAEATLSQEFTWQYDETAEAIVAVMLPR